MNEIYDRLKVLLYQYNSGIIAPGEERELFGLLNANPEIDIEPLLAGILEDTEPQPDELRRQRLLEKIFASAIPSIEEDRELAPVKRIFPLRQVAAAAAIVMLLFSGYYLLINKPGNKNELAGTSGNAKDVEAPKSTKAQITLANGQTVFLDSITSGTIAQQGNVNIVKMKDGQIVYNGSSKEAVYNTLFNPRGSMVVTLSLSDGTKVWLNSESSIRYPVAFVGTERNVEITGEAYFEVAKDATKKFIVTGNNVATEVLGTHFNVNAYTDETNIRVTLLEGAVKVSKGASAGLLQPGQQAQVSEGVKVTDNIDVDAVMAWKNGYFHFGNTSIQDLMKQLARWYDVEIVYEGKVPVRQFGGEISREANLSQVLKILNESKVKCRIEGKSLLIE